MVKKIDSKKNFFLKNKKVLGLITGSVALLCGGFAISKSFSNSVISDAATENTKDIAGGSHVGSIDVYFDGTKLGDPTEDNPANVRYEISFMDTLADNQKVDLTVSATKIDSDGNPDTSGERLTGLPTKLNFISGAEFGIGNTGDTSLKDTITYKNATLKMGNYNSVTATNSDGDTLSTSFSFYDMSSSINSPGRTGEVMTASYIINQQYKKIFSGVFGVRKLNFKIGSQLLTFNNFKPINIEVASSRLNLVSSINNYNNEYPLAEDFSSSNFSTSGTYDKTLNFKYGLTVDEYNDSTISSLLSLFKQTKSFDINSKVTGVASSKYVSGKTVNLDNDSSSDLTANIPIKSLYEYSYNSGANSDKIYIGNSSANGASVSGNGFVSDNVLNLKIPLPQAYTDTFTKDSKGFGFTITMADKNRLKTGGSLNSEFDGYENIVRRSLYSTISNFKDFYGNPVEINYDAYETVTSTKKTMSASSVIYKNDGKVPEEDKPVDPKNIGVYINTVNSTTLDPSKGYDTAYTTTNLLDVFVGADLVNRDYYAIGKGTVFWGIYNPKYFAFALRPGEYAKVELGKYKGTVNQENMSSAKETDFNWTTLDSDDPMISYPSSATSAEAAALNASVGEKYLAGYNAYRVTFVKDVPMNAPAFSSNSSEKYSVTGINTTARDTDGTIDPVSMYGRKFRILGAYTFSSGADPSIKDLKYGDATIKYQDPINNDTDFQAMGTFNAKVTISKTNDKTSDSYNSVLSNKDWALDPFDFKTDSLAGYKYDSNYAFTDLYPNSVKANGFRERISFIKTDSSRFSHTSFNTTANIYTRDTTSSSKAWRVGRIAGDKTPVVTPSLTSENMEDFSVELTVPAYLLPRAKLPDSTMKKLVDDYINDLNIVNFNLNATSITANSNSSRIITVYHRKIGVNGQRKMNVNSIDYPDFIKLGSFDTKGMTKDEINAKLKTYLPAILDEVESKLYSLNGTDAVNTSFSTGLYFTSSPYSTSNYSLSTGASYINFDSISSLSRYSYLKAFLDDAKYHNGNGTVASIPKANFASSFNSITSKQYGINYERFYGATSFMTSETPVGALSNEKSEFVFYSKPGVFDTKMLDKFRGSISLPRNGIDNSSYEGTLKLKAFEETNGYSSNIDYFYTNTLKTDDELKPQEPFEDGKNGWIAWDGVDMSVLTNATAIGFQVPDLKSITDFSFKMTYEVSGNNSWDVYRSRTLIGYGSSFENKTISNYANFIAFDSGGSNLEKIDGKTSAPLSGAVFKVAESKEDAEKGNYLKLVDANYALTANSKRMDKAWLIYGNKDMNNDGKIDDTDKALWVSALPDFEIITDEDKVTSFEGLELNDGGENKTYYLVETQAPDGYIVQAKNNLYEVSVGKDNTVSSKIVVKNYEEEQGGTLSIDTYKLDGLLAGTEQYKDASYVVKDSEGNIVLEETQNDNGSYKTITAELPFGTYKVYHVTVGDGYELSKEVKTVTISENNPDQKVKFILSKVLELPMTGAKFKLSTVYLGGFLVLSAALCGAGRYIWISKFKKDGGLK